MARDEDKNKSDQDILEPAAAMDDNKSVLKKEIELNVSKQNSLEAQKSDNMLNLSADLSAPQKPPHNSVTLSPIDTLRSMISPKLRAEGSGESSKPRILFSCLKQFFCTSGQPIPLLNSERRKNSEDLFGWAQDEAVDEEHFVERRSKAKEA